MQNWFPIGSRLQVVTTAPKCDAARPTKSFAPLIWLEILFSDYLKCLLKLLIDYLNTGLLKVFFDVINRSDGLMDLIYELRIISTVFSALAIVFLSLVLFNFVIANYAQVARLCSIMKAILCKFFIHLYTYFILGLYLPACVNPMRQKKS